jgi:hypothetical protein
MPALDENPARPKARRPLGWRSFAKTLVAAGLLGWLVGSGRLDLRVLASTPLSPFHALGLLVLLIATVLQAWRWWLLIRIQRIDLTFLRTFGLVWIGRFLALALPGVVGGDVVLGYYIVREAPSARLAGLSTVVADRAIGFYTSFLLGFLALAWAAGSGEALEGPVLEIGAVTLFCVLGATLAFSSLRVDPVRGRILKVLPARFRDSLEQVLAAYRARGRALALCLALSLVIGVLSMGAYMVAGRVIGSPLTWKQVFLVCPLVFVATALPISPSGIGVGEAAASVLFARFDVETGATLMLIVRLWFLALRLPGALFFVFRGRRYGSIEL